jgi:hypothetical protein
MTRARYKRVLAEINLIRWQCGRPPLDKVPLGDRREPDSCPIALACKGTAFHDTIHAGGVDGVVLNLETPRVLRAFMRDFDNGQFPELVKQ